MGKAALTIQADTFQFFTRNPRGGAVRTLDTEDMAALVHLQKEAGFVPLVAHAPYTLNACGAESRVRGIRSGGHARRFEAAGASAWKSV